jgi:hypothetical protein
MTMRICKISFEDGVYKAQYYSPVRIFLIKLKLLFVSVFRKVLNFFGFNKAPLIKIKLCSSCNKKKNVNDFPKKGKKCKCCQKKYRKFRYEKNKESEKSRSKKYYYENREKCLMNKRVARQKEKDIKNLEFNFVNNENKLLIK